MNLWKDAFSPVASGSRHRIRKRTERRGWEESTEGKSQESHFNGYWLIEATRAVGQIEVDEEKDVLSDVCSTRTETIHAQC